MGTVSLQSAISPNSYRIQGVASQVQLAKSAIACDLDEDGYKDDLKLSNSGLAFSFRSCLVASTFNCRSFASLSIAYYCFIMFIASAALRAFLFALIMLTNFLLNESIHS